MPSTTSASSSGPSTSSPALAAETTSAGELGDRGRYVMVHGRLTPGGPRSWPSLDGHVAVIPPSAVFGSERHTIPSAARLEKIRAELRDGIDVVVRGEVARAGLYAVSITARDGVLDL